MVAGRRIAPVAVLLAVAACGDNNSPSTPTQLAFAVEPNATSDGARLAPAVVVTVVDAAGRTVWSWTDTVRLALAAGDDSASLVGTASVAAVSGTAVFQDLRVSGGGTGHRLVASSGNLAEASSEPFTVHGVFAADSVAAGYMHTCALAFDGTAYCWGLNRSGQLGNGAIDSSPAPPHAIPLRVMTPLHFAAVVSGWTHACGLTSAGTAYCWGANDNGQLGSGNTTPSATPQQVVFGSPFVSLAAGYYHTCGLTAGGQAYCWGWNGYGALGDGTDSTRTVPTAVTGGLAFAALTAGFEHTCGLTADGTAYCWGANLYGEVGDGETYATAGHVAAPSAVAGDHRFASLFAGGGPCHGETCGITTDGETWCWGHDYQPSDPFQGKVRTTPARLAGDPGFVALSPGGLVLCGITAGGALYCWGEGYVGASGTGLANRVVAPIPILPESSFVQVSGGGSHTCAVTTGGATYCWGDNTSGQLGTGASLSGWTVPVPVWKP